VRVGEKEGEGGHDKGGGRRKGGGMEGEKGGGE